MVSPIIQSLNALANHLEGYRSPVRGHLAAFILGLLFAFGFSPYHFWPLTLISTTLFLLLLDKQPTKPALIRSLSYGIGVYLHGISWVFISIYTFGETPLISAVPLTAALVTGFSLLYVVQTFIYIRIKGEHGSYLTFAAIWTLFDWVRSWLLTGCPWLLTGYAFIDTPLAGYAPVTGVYGVSLAVNLSAALLVYLLKQRPPRRSLTNYLAPILLITIWSTGALLQQISWVEIDHTANSKLDVALIQANIGQDRKWAPETLEPTKALYRKLTMESLKHKEWHPDLIVWPEAAIPSFYHEEIPYFSDIEQRLYPHKATLITGVLSAIFEKGTYIYYNSIIAFGRGYGIYHKQKLVPFGEVYPFTEELKSIIPFYGQMKSFTPGANDQLLLTVGDHKIASYICYEVIYPDLARVSAQQADYLLTISNDAWFGRSLAPWQHFQMARMRALENGRYMLRATNTGVTGIIDYKGQVSAITPQFNATVLKGTVYKMQGFTPFTRTGSTPILVVCLVLLLICTLYTYFQNRLMERNE